MAHLTIRNCRTGDMIYQGEFESAKACLEQAAREKINLDGADLHHANLAGAALDDIVMRNARLDGANLAGANLSEAVLDGTSFRGASLQDACLCLSSLVGCAFDGATFGATDIAGAILRLCSFSTLSALSLNYIDAQTIDRCRYTATENADICGFSSPPVVLQGLPLPVAFLGRHLKIGGAVRTARDWFAQANDNGAERDSRPQHFFTEYKPVLWAIWQKISREDVTSSRGRIGEGLA